MIYMDVINHCDVRMSETINPYKAKASPKIRIKIIPTKILSCWAFARTPASPTMPIDKPAALINILVPVNWSHSKGLRPNGHNPIARCKGHQLNKQECTSLDNDDSNDHAVDTQDTCHDDRYNWLHDEFWLEDSHGTDADSGLSWSVSSSKVGEDKGWGNSDISKEVLRHVDDDLWDMNIMNKLNQNIQNK